MPLGRAPARGSVLETGLVGRPVRWAKDRETDISGLGSGGDQAFVRPGVIDAYTDQMRMGPRERALAPARNRPRLDGRDLHARDHLPALVAGFRESYDLVAGARDEIAGLLRACADLEVRFIPRHTQRYGLLLDEAKHPDYLRDALAFELLLDHLHVEAHVLPVMRRLIPGEQADLRRGDYPRFTTRPGERHLYDTRGGRIEGFFERSGLDEALERLAAAGAEDREAQVAVLSEHLAGAGAQAHAAR
jgi:lantibiotic modifying enzyme